MKTLLRISDFVMKLLGVAIVLVAVMATCSCGSVKYVPVETVMTDSIRVVDVQRDSIFVQDSVFIREKADTVFVTKWHTEFREFLKVDTMLVERVDSINHVVEVERDFTVRETLLMNTGRGVLWAVPIFSFLYILYRKLKK